MNKITVETVYGEAAIKGVEKTIISGLKIFQTYDWLSVSGNAVSAVICYDEKKRILAYLPLVESTKFKVKGFHIPPYTPYFGPVILEADVFHKGQIVESILKPIKNSKHLDFVIPSGDEDIVSYSRLGFSIEASQTHIIEKEGAYSLSSIHGSKRRYLKKLLDMADSGRINIKYGRNCIEDLLYLNNETEKRAGFKGNKEVLKELVNRFGSDENILVIYSEKGNPLSGAFFPGDTQFAYHLINASLRDEDNILDKANLLSTYKAVSQTLSRGKSFDFEGSNIPGVAAFYRMMGGKPVINLRMQKSGSFLYALLRAGIKIKKERYDF